MPSAPMRRKFRRESPSQKRLEGPGMVSIVLNSEDAKARRKKT
jgi:hypothetical protein